MKWMEEHHDVTQDGSQGETQGGIQDVLQDGELDDWIRKTDKKESKDYSKRTNFIIPKRIKYHQATHCQTSSYSIRWKWI